MKMVQKKREGEGRISKTLHCAAALAANVYNYKAQWRVARERAVLKYVTRLEAFFLRLSVPKADFVIYVYLFPIYMHNTY